MVSFTENALEEVKKILAKKEDSAMCLRVGVQGGGCSGLSYVLGLDYQTDDDMDFDIQGIPVIIDKSQGIYLMGMQIDYGKGLDARGFVFENPNASSTCGCGISFAV